MKKFTVLILTLLLLCSVPIFASAEIETSLTVTPPDKVYYTVGEAPDYTGGFANYTAQETFAFPLSAENCTGLDTSTPGNKTVTVTQAGLTAYFRVVVLSNEEPISAMRDMNRKHWAYPYLGATMKAGFFTGDNASMIRPDASITRAEMAQIIYRAYQNDPVAMEESADASEPFPDVPANTWFYEAVEACRKAGLIHGDEGAFKPNDEITRQDAVLILMRIDHTEEELATADVDALLAAYGKTPADFKDVASYARGAFALALGSIISGNETGLVTPRNSIRRSESATIFKRLFMDDYEWVAPPAPSPIIYLSPSNQFNNQYTGVNTTEGEQMYRVGRVVKRILEAEGYTVVMPDRSIHIRDRCLEANEMGASVYVAIHSNAGGGTGTRGFYNGANPGSKEMSTEVFIRVAALTAGKDILKEDYLCLQGGKGTPFIEVGTPTVPNLLLEVEFHDNATGAKWIVNHTEDLGRAIAEGIIAYCTAYPEGVS